MDANATAGLPAYAELHCRSNLSFLTGASRPEELAERAAQLGYHALAITDECSLAGIVRAHTEAKNAGVRLVVGAWFRLQHPQNSFNSIKPITYKNSDLAIPTASVRRSS